jgi:beta-galactosidase
MDSQIEHRITRTLRSGFLYGGDYNPEQWMAAMGYPDDAVWREDLHLMREAGVNLVTIGVFSWASLQPAEDIYTFEWLDRIFAMLAEAEIGVCLGTGTAAQPAWLSAAYPDVLPVTQWGARKRHGHRMNYCPTNPDFRRLANALVTRLAERYRDHPALRLWHVSNEYGPDCFCDRCAARFREWLQTRYGSLDALNARWVTAFWSHNYTAWEQIEPPSPLDQHGEHETPALLLDYRRFMSDMNLAGYTAEAAILREVTPQIPITTNFHGLVKGLDYFSWAPHVDVVSWDSYPAYGAHPSGTAFRFDLMRGLKGGQSWLLMEQSPNQVQWHLQNPGKRPGEMRAQSYQAIAHGSDGALFFQWRQSRGSAEMFHSAVVSHAGHADTRVFREVAALGKELRHLDRGIVGTSVPARVALLFDWPNWWAVEAGANPSHTLDYMKTVQQYYRALWDRQITVDVVSPDMPLGAYHLVIAPLWMMVAEQHGAAIERYVEQGGMFLATYFSGIVDEDGRAWLGGYPGPLRRALGLWVEEVDPFTPDMSNTVIATDQALASLQGARCSQWGEVVRLEGAVPLATFGQDYYAGYPVITRHQFGAGTAYYVATQLDDEALGQFIGAIAVGADITPALSASPGVEVTVRQGNQTTYLFVINHLATTQDITLPTPMTDLLTNERHSGYLQLPPKGVMILVAG